MLPDQFNQIVLYKWLGDKIIASQFLSKSNWSWDYSGRFQGLKNQSLASENALTKLLMSFSTLLIHLFSTPEMQIN